MAKLNGTSITGVSLNRLMLNTPLAMDRTQGLIIRGINPVASYNMVPVETSNIGYTFFTRPMFNMTSPNLRNDSRLSYLLTGETLSIQRAIRVLLDTALCGYDDSMITPLVDDANAFIPILSNTIKSMSGWPDPTLDYHTSDAGLMGQKWIVVDSALEMYSDFPLTCTFARTKGGMILSMFYYWMLMMSLLFRHQLSPWPNAIAERYVCYQTRPYRIVLDSSGRFVSGIAYAGNMIPVGMNLGEMFDFNVEKPILDNGVDIQVQFQAVGAVYNEPICAVNFNDCVAQAKPEMHPLYRDAVMRVIPRDRVVEFKGYCYPHIDLDTSEFTWWTDTQTYDRLI